MDVAEVSYHVRSERPVARPAVTDV